MIMLGEEKEKILSARLTHARPYAQQQYKNTTTISQIERILKGLHVGCNIKRTKKYFNVLKHGLVMS